MNIRRDWNAYTVAPQASSGCYKEHVRKLDNWVRFNRREPEKLLP